MRNAAIAIVAALTVLTGCLNKGGNVPFEEVNIGKTVRDTMVHGFCLRGSNAQRLNIVTDGGDTLRLDISLAQQENHVLGNYAIGDEMAVIVNADTTEASMVVNKSALEGNWVLPNPIDGSSEMGVSILKGGMAESIDQSEIIYKSWRLFNGKLVFTLAREDGIGQDETQVFRIVRLKRDSLIVSDGEDLYEYSRQKMEKEDELDIELDDGMDDFFL